MPRTYAPSGAWRSPLTADGLATAGVRVTDVVCEGSTVLGGNEADRSGADHDHAPYRRRHNQVVVTENSQSVAHGAIHVAGFLEIDSTVTADKAGQTR